MTTEELRRHMVDRQLRARGIHDAAVLRAMAEVPREAFVAEAFGPHAYDDCPLSIPEGQTISQPYIVALMAEALELTPECRVLEVGAGSGYATAVMGRLAGEVYGVERHGALAVEAEERLGRLGYDNVHLECGDGSVGWAEHAPFDAISVAAGGPRVPPSLLAQLAPGGRLVMPVGPNQGLQELVRMRRTAAPGFQREALGSVSFVPLIGAEGW